jgi:hypothetical protein
MQVLKTISMFRLTTKKLLEASIGLCVQISKFTSIEEFTRILVVEANSSKKKFTAILLEILNENIDPNAQFPCIRRHVIELVIWIMESDDRFIQDSEAFEMQRALMKITVSTAEFENFHYFSGNSGVMEHQKTISSLLWKTKLLLARRTSVFG